MSKFNKSIENLPSNIVFIKFGDTFAQPIKKIPPTLSNLVIGHKYPHSIMLMLMLSQNLISYLDEDIVSLYTK